MLSRPEIPFSFWYGCFHAVIAQYFIMTADCDSACPYYDYDPSIAGNAILLAAYSILIPAVFYPGLRISTLAFSIILVAGLALDVIGFVGRLLLSRSPDGQDYFTISLIGTILGPTLITCAVILTFPCTLSLCDLYVSHLRRGFAVLLLLVSTLGAAVLEVIGIVSVAYRLGDISVSLHLCLCRSFSCVADIHSGHEVPSSLPVGWGFKQLLY